MKVLSLFDGISCARVALERAKLPVEAYYASEIDEYAIKISNKNYPDIIQLGSVTNVHGLKNCHGVSIGLWQNQKIDLLIGGSPCQDLSAAKGKDRLGLKGSRSSLFYEYMRILKEVKPKYFILENVASMSKEAQDEITKTIGVEPIMIDASLVSAQIRKRLFWTNIPGIQLPKDKNIVLKDIINHSSDRKYIRLDPNIKVRKTKTGGLSWDTLGKGYFSQQDRAYSINSKHATIPTARTITKAKVVFEDDNIGILNWNEIEALQSLPTNYTDLGLDNKNEKRGGVIGNGFNVDVVAHILSFIPKHADPKS